MRIVGFHLSDGDCFILLAFFFLLGTIFISSISSIFAISFSLAFGGRLFLIFILSVYELAFDDHNTIVKPKYSRGPSFRAITVLLFFFISIRIEIIDVFNLRIEFRLEVIISCRLFLFFFTLLRGLCTKLFQHFFELDSLKLRSLHTTEEHVLTIIKLPDQICLSVVEDSEVLGPAPQGLSLSSDLVFRFDGVADVVFEETGSFKGSDPIGIGSQVDELVRQVLEVDDDELVHTVLLADIEEALGVVADAELLVALEGRHAKGGVLQADVALVGTAGTPDRDAAVVVGVEARVVHALLLEASSLKLDALALLEHVAGVLTIFIRIGLISIAGVIIIIVVLVRALLRVIVSVVVLIFILVVVIVILVFDMLLLLGVLLWLGLFRLRLFLFLAVLFFFASLDTQVAGSLSCRLPCRFRDGPSGFARFLLRLFGLLFGAQLGKLQLTCLLFGLHLLQLLGRHWVRQLVVLQGLRRLDQLHGHYKVLVLLAVDDHVAGALGVVHEAAFDEGDLDGALLLVVLPHLREIQVVRVSLLADHAAAHRTHVR